MPKVRELIERLQEQYDPEDTIAYAIWSRDDIQEAIDGMNDPEYPEDNIVLSPEEQDALLEEIDNRQDLSVNGIGWADRICYL